MGGRSRHTVGVSLAKNIATILAMILAWTESGTSLSIQSYSNDILFVSDHSHLYKTFSERFVIWPFCGTLHNKIKVVYQLRTTKQRVRLERCSEDNQQKFPRLQKRVARITLDAGPIFPSVQSLISVPGNFPERFWVHLFSVCSEKSINYSSNYNNSFICMTITANYSIAKNYLQM